MAWPMLDGQRERRMLAHWPRSGDELHVLTWKPVVGFGNPLSSLGWSTFREGDVIVHSAPRLPNLRGRFTGNYARGLWANELLFRAYANRLIRKLKVDVLVYGLSHKLVGLPPFDAPVMRVFDYLDLCVYPEIERAYLEHSDLVLCTSTVLADRVRARGGHAVYIPNGINQADAAGGRRESVRQRLGLEGKTVVSLIGLTYSDTLFFVDAIALARRTIPNLVFMFVGGGVAKHDLVRPLVERCEALGVPYVRTGWVRSDAVADYFAATDVGLYPGASNDYFDAACPIKVLEYTAARRPVVATDLEELRRMAFPNVILERPDPVAFAAAVVRAVMRPMSYPNLARFEWASLAAASRDAIVELLARRVAA
jgi:glycosyltransferase involved in cell wall biosynthesis